MMKTIATYLSNGKYNSLTERVDYTVTKKEIEVSWYKSIDIDGIETSAIGIYPTFVNEHLDSQHSVFKLSENNYVVYDSWFKYTGNSHRNNFSNLEEAINFIESIKLFIENKFGVCVEKN